MLFENGNAETTYTIHKSLDPNCLSNLTFLCMKNDLGINNINKNQLTFHKLEDAIREYVFQHVESVYITIISHYVV